MRQQRGITGTPNLRHCRYRDKCEQLLLSKEVMSEELIAHLKVMRAPSPLAAAHTDVPYMHMCSQHGLHVCGCTHARTELITHLIKRPPSHKR